MEHDLLYENKQHSTSLKPFNYLPSIMPNYFLNVPLHWHKEIEINYIRSGKVNFTIDAESFIAAPFES